MANLSLARKYAKKLRAEYEPSNSFIDVYKVAESEGIKIRQEDAFEKDMSGLFLNDNDGNFIIAVNSTHSKKRKRFTVAHELGHFFLHKEERLHYDPFKSDNPNNIFFRMEGVISSEETEANHFAAELLMPEEKVRVDFVDTPEVSILAEKYGVSKAAMMYRLVNLELM